MNIDVASIESLNVAKYNPRKDLKPTDPEYVKLKNSVEHFGYVEPVIVNKRNMTVVGGHQRLKVLKDLGYKEIEVVYVDLSDIDEKALNIALNKISGDWDADKLEDLLREISLDTEFDSELTGFSLDEIETMFNGSDKELEEADKQNNKNSAEREEELNKLCEEHSMSRNKRNIKLGDAYKLGRHKILCGDSYNEATYKKLVGSNNVALIFTDPPYNYESMQRDNRDAWSGAFKGSKDNVSAIKKVKLQNFSKLSIEKLEYLFNKNIKSIYCCCCINDLYDYLTLGKMHDYKCDVHVWCKTSCIPMHGGENCGNYLKDIEYIVFFSKSGRTFNNELPFGYYHQFNTDNTIDIDKFERQWYSHYKYLAASEVTKDKKEANSEHPTVKPLKLIIPKIAISSNEDDIVVDMFCGSGSTLIACEKLNRICYAVEYSPEYVNETIDRWEALTGLKAEKIENTGDTDERDS